MRNSNKEPLPLSDWNQLLVNLKLLQSISNEAGKRGKIKKLYDNLDSSLKTDSDNTVTYDGFRNQIQEDLKKLLVLAKDPINLHKWLISRHHRKELQVRIRPDHFLLNNILLLRGLSFEDLFDKEKLPGQADPAKAEQIKKDDFDKEEKEKLDNELLLQIDDKLDKVLEKLIKGKTHHSFRRCFYNLIEYRLYLHLLIDWYYVPKENGFSFSKENPEKKLSKQEIYALSYMVLRAHINKIHANHHIRKLLAKMNTMVNDDFNLGRILCSLFILSILLYLINNLVAVGINRKRPVFQILEGNHFVDFFKETKSDNTKIKEKIKEALEKTNSLIEHIQDSNLTLNENYCVRCEILLVDFFSKIELLFNKLRPVFTRWSDIINAINSSNSRKTMEESLNKLSEIGRSLTFWIEPKQIDCFDEYIDNIEELQIGLEKYYVGYVDESAIAAKAIETGHDPSGNLPARGD
jgi:hypothetical protein